MINCIIVDDERHAIDVLQNHIGKIPFLNLLNSYTRPHEALEALKENNVHLVFLDIQMPEISGIDFAKAIAGKAKVIFTTAYSNYAVDGFELEVIDYLLKPVGFSRFLKAANRALALINKTEKEGFEEIPLEDDYIFVKTELKGKLIKINLGEIDYIKGMKNYVAFHHNGIMTLALLNMKDIEERLPSKYFKRVQKSFIIPIRKVTGMDGNIIRLNGVNTEIQLGPLYKAEFMNLLRDKLMT